jgi:hypothetical protein
MLSTEAVGDRAEEYRQFRRKLSQPVDQFVYGQACTSGGRTIQLSRRSAKSMSPSSPIKRRKRR